VSVELSMGGDYYHACCGDPEPDIPEGPKLPCVGEKVRGGEREPLCPPPSSLLRDRSFSYRLGIDLI